MTGNDQTGSMQPLGQWNRVVTEALRRAAAIQPAVIFVSDEPFPFLDEIHAPRTCLAAGLTEIPPLWKSFFIDEQQTFVLTHDQSAAEAAKMIYDAYFGRLIRNECLAKIHARQDEVDRAIL